MEDALESTKDNGPWWASLIKTIGVTSALCLFLAWFITQGIDSRMERIETNTQYTSAQMSNLINEQRSVKIVLQQICANTAGTNKDRALCFQ